ncbi:MAG TPA: alpha/beta hydrolase [Acidobacteriaceae bacterium]|nr:alpha/beta hydrolase [Acidobacteriaceae bacterium]
MHLTALRSAIHPTILVLAAFCLFQSPAAPEDAPLPPGKLVELGGHRLHVNCTGQGRPVVVVENGLGDFSFDWILVQQRVARFTRICTYDRAGYAWSDAGPMPRTFAQINLELREALRVLGERGPFVLVGHSYGGPVMRNFATTWPAEVAGMVFVDAAWEGMRVQIGEKQTVRLGGSGQERAVPKPHERWTASDKDALRAMAEPPHPAEPLDPLYQKLPEAEQRLQQWAQNLPNLEPTEASQRQWSEVDFARLLAHPEPHALRSIPTIVLSRSEGGYTSDLDVPAAQMEQERKDGQAMLARLSKKSKQVFLHCGHNMEIEDPAGVADAIQQAVEAARHRGNLQT